MNLSRIKDVFLFRFFWPLFPFIFSASSLLALPKTHQVKVGTATLSESGKHLHIVTGDKTIIHWKDFSINHGETVRFIQPGKESAVLNRVTGSSPSKIFGTLKANGSLYLINKHGVIIGKEGLVEVGNFLASTLDVRNSDFLNGKELLFNGKTQQGITNLGTIHAWDGTVTLLGFTVVNSGHIEADRVQMGAGHSILLKPDGEGIYIKTSSGEKGEVGISHTGTIHALETQLKADGNLYALAIKDDGIIDAGSFINRSGRVYLVGDGGTTEVGGFINAPKGNVQILGTRVGLINEGFIDVSGEGQGGTIRLGDPESTDALFVGPNTKLLADGIGHGSGGEIITWGKGANRFYGRAEARGGKLSVDGGFVEVSSKGSFEFFASGDVTASNGLPGRFFLDPTDITLTAAADSFVFPGTPNYTVFAVATANVDVTAAGPLVTLLNGGNPVTISTNTTGPSTGTLTVSDPFTWTSGATLTLVSNNLMTINESINAGATGSVVLISGGQNGASLGGITVNSPGNIFSNNGNITMTSNGGGDITINGPAGFVITTGTGNINMTGSNDILLNGGIVFAINGDMNITASRDVSLTGNATIQEFGGATNLNITAGRNILLQNSIITSFSADLLLTAGRDVRIQQSSQVTKSGSGDLTIVCDNDFPTFPLQGPGAFILDASSIVNHTGSSGPIHTPGPIRIFTSVRAQNNIQGNIRGVPFVPGPKFVDSNLERWCSYFNNSFSAFPFTIFYKECLEAFVQIFQQSSAPIVTVEALRDFHPYDEYLGWPLFFDFEYREMERSPVPYFKRIDKRGERNPKDKEVKTFDFFEFDIL